MLQLALYVLSEVQAESLIAEDQESGYHVVWSNESMRLIVTEVV